MSDAPRSETISFEDLQDWIGFKQTGRIKQWLQDNGVLYTLDAKRRPITTASALNAALRGRRKEKPNWNAIT